MPEKTLTVVALSAEPKTTQAGKQFWIATDSEDREWLVWNQELSDAIRERKLQELTYDVYEIEKDGKMRRSINGLPGVVEAQKRSVGGKNWQPRDYAAEERAKHPSFALSYAKDLCIAKGDLSSEAVVKTAQIFYDWLKGQAESTAGQVSPASSSQPLSASGEPQPASNGHEDDLAIRPLMIGLRREIKGLDPQHNFVTSELLAQMSLEELQATKKEIVAALS